MLKFTYLALDIGAILCALVIGITQHQAWLHEWSRTLKAISCVAIPFVLWDISATWRGHWSFNSDYTLGLTIAGLPLEELLFFIAIPLISIAVWESLPVVRTIGQWYRPALGIVIALCGIMLVTSLGKEYSTLVSIVAAGSAALWLVSPEPIRQWFYFQIVMFGLFTIANTVLTALPVVEYGNAFYSGIRLGTIPLEDFLYNFALVNLSILAWLLPSRINK